MSRTLSDESSPATTTGNQHFAECQMLCRAQNIGHSAKILFAECRTRQRQTHGEFILYRVSGTRQSKTLGKDHFAEGRALGKGWHSANRRQEVTVGHAVIVCRVFGPRHSAKRACAECRGQTLGKIFKFFFFNFSKFFSIVFLQSPEQDMLFRFFYPSVCYISIIYFIVVNFLNNSNLNYVVILIVEKMYENLLFMLMSMLWCLNEERTTNFKPTIHKTWRLNYVQVVFKLYKR
jgi:hypothetical protein